MKEQFIGTTQIPSCMIGTWAWGTGMNGSKMVFGKKYDKEILKSVFKKACELGFTLLDTAEVYGMGRSEKLLGECINGISEKENIMISTKYMPSKKFNKVGVQKSLNKSMERLGIDHVDIYWLHNSNNYQENINAITELKKSGKVKHIGISNFTFNQIKEANNILNKDGMKIDAVQNHFSLLHMTDEQINIIDWCNQNHVTYFSYMVLEQGALSGKYNSYGCTYRNQPAKFCYSAIMHSNATIRYTFTD
jgi:aryl-alcohol dehydrogenase-like predicted oxidoreductase